MGVGVCQTRQRSSSQNCPSLAVGLDGTPRPSVVLLGIFSNDAENIDMFPTQPEGRRLVILWTSSSSHDVCCHCRNISRDTIHAGLSWDCPNRAPPPHPPQLADRELLGFTWEVHISSRA